MLRASVRDLKSLDLPVHVIFYNLDHYDSGPNVIDRIRNVWSAQYNNPPFAAKWTRSSDGANPRFAHEPFALSLNRVIKLNIEFA